MAKKTNAVKKTTANDKNIGYETFDLLTGETFNPILNEQLEAEKEKEFMSSMRAQMREPAWVDVVKCICNVSIKDKPKLTYNTLTKFSINMAYFMTLQGYSHTCPLQANALNISTINTKDATDIIRMYINKKYRNGWNAVGKFFPINKKEEIEVQYVDSENKKTSRKITENDIKDFCKKMRWSLTDYDMYVEMYSKEEAEVLVAQYCDMSEKKGSDFVKKINKNERADYDDDFDHTRDNSVQTIIQTQNLEPVQNTSVNANVVNAAPVQQQTVVPTIQPQVQQVQYQTQQTQQVQQPAFTPQTQTVSQTPQININTKKTAAQQPETTSKRTTIRPKLISEICKPTVSKNKSQTENLIPIVCADGIPVMFRPTDLNLIDNIC